MSSASAVSSVDERPDAPEDRTPAARRGAPWAWALIACALLGAGGAGRAMQESRHLSEKAYKETCPIDLSKFPKQFGREWKLVKGGERSLDELTMRITGGTDYVIRTFANDLTGVSVTILILFGPAEPVLPHTPQICYPATGFTPGDFPILRGIEFSRGGLDEKGEPLRDRADFLAATYSKANGRQPLREVVYHSFRLDGQWSPFIGQGRKFPRRNPGIFKVQIHRVIADSESVGEGDPIEQFLQLFLADLEAQIKAAGVVGDAAGKDAPK
jgi:Protein of unknown function (DUF3485)